MQQSEDTKELAAALAKVQGELPKVSRDKEGQIGKRKYRYASLGNVVDVVGPVLAKHEMATNQSLTHSDGWLICTTRLRHSSGQWVDCDVVVPFPSGLSNQDAGVATSYARRYGLSATVGIVVEDDTDGAGSRNGSNGQTRKRGSAGLKDRLQSTKPSRPVNQTEDGHTVTLGTGNPEQSGDEGNIWIDYSEVPARVLMHDGSGSFDELMPDDAPCIAAHKTLARMISTEAKKANIDTKELLAMVTAEDGLDTPATRFSEVSIGALARVLVELECPLL